MTDLIELAYNLHLLPAGRVAIRGGRWEMWRGSQLVSTLRERPASA